MELRTVRSSWSGLTEHIDSVAVRGMPTAWTVEYFPEESKKKNYWEPLKGSLRNLGFLTSHNEPTELFKRYVQETSDGRNTILREVLTAHWPAAWSLGPHSTRDELTQLLAPTGWGTDTKKKFLSFFVTGGQAVGLDVPKGWLATGSAGSKVSVKRAAVAVSALPGRPAAGPRKSSPPTRLSTPVGGVSDQHMITLSFVEAGLAQLVAGQSAPSEELAAYSLLLTSLRKSLEKRS